MEVSNQIIDAIPPTTSTEMRAPAEDMPICDDTGFTSPAPPPNQMINESTSVDQSATHKRKRNESGGSSSPIANKRWVPRYESNQDIIRKRQKQIDYGKNTIGYARYRQTVPKRDRKPGDPKTPNKYLVHSRRSWDQLVKNWRKRLHTYDPTDGEGEDTDIGLSEFMSNTSFDTQSLSSTTIDNCLGSSQPDSEFSAFDETEFPPLPGSSTDDGFSSSYTPHQKGFWDIGTAATSSEIDLEMEGFEFQVSEEADFLE